MTDNEENCLVSLDMRRQAEQICVQQWQEVEKPAVRRSVREDLESVDRELKGALVRAERRKRQGKRNEEKEKGKR